MDQRPRIKGIFSNQKEVKVGAGATAKRHLSTAYWKAEELDDGNVSMQGLDGNWQPQGRMLILPKEKLFQDYKLEPEVWYELVTLKVSHGDAHREAGRLHEAQIDYTQVRAVDEDNIRANFGLGLVYLSLGQEEKASYVFERLLELKETFAPQHKHLFNEFGIALRKRGLLDRTLIYYSKALALSPDDENLHFNLARCHFERKDAPALFAHLRVALQIDPEHAESLRLLRHALKRGLVPPEEHREVLKEFARAAKRLRREDAARAAHEMFADMLETDSESDEDDEIEDDLDDEADGDEDEEDGGSRSG